MDTITHTVLGACTGELIAGKKIGKKAMAIGALVNNLPDIDMIANFWHSPAEGLLSHRGLTHSIFFCVLIVPVLIWIFRWLFRVKDLDYKTWMLLIAHGLFLHISLDAFTTYGTGWFEPFSHYRVSFNTLFILDPTLMLPLLLGTIVLLILKKDRNKTRKIIAAVALGLSLVYLLITITIKLNINKIINDEIVRQEIHDSEFMGIPSPLNNLLWFVLIKEGNDYRTGYYSILDSTKHIQLQRIKRNDSLLSPYENVNDVQLLRRFSKDYYSLRPIEGGIQFSDMRFGQLSVADTANPEFVFNFDVREKNGSTIVTQSEFKKLQEGDLYRLRRRIMGHR